MLTILALFPLLLLVGSPSPPAAAAAGYKTLVEDEEFSTPTVASRPDDKVLHNWYPGVWWQGPPKPVQINVSNGVLDLHWSRSTWLQNHMCQTTVQSISSTGAIGHTFRYGYFEARMKWDNVKGAWPAFWMSPVQVIQGRQEFGEIDIFEGTGLDTNFYGTLHTWKSGRMTWSSSPNQFPVNADFAQWHTYGALWTPGKITWYFDDKPLMTANTPTLFDQEDYFLLLTSQEGVNWKCVDPQHDGSAPDLHVYVDWVRVWK